MSITCSYRKPLVVAVACLAVISWNLSGHGQEGERKAGQGVGAKNGPSPLYYGVSACTRCHNEKKPLEDANLPPLCRCTEVRIWESGDKHKDAYNVLVKGTIRGARAQQMGKLLGIDDVAKSDSCLSCHAVVLHDDKLKDTTFKLADGVNCVVCHGAFEDWIDQHGSGVGRKREKWREYSRQQKEKDFGMADLWDPARRTAKCDSCHIGNREEGKFVTHAMYAAGHPPLPGIEIATFSNQMPRHWEYIKEKKPVVQKLLGFDPATDTFEQTKLVVVSSAMALRETMHLLAAQAEDCAKAPDQGVLDLANFDCYACHHDLKLPSWRQKRGYAGQPGRPQMRPWSTALVKLCLREITKNENANQELDRRLEQVYKAFDERPFGNCSAIARSAQELVGWLDPLIATLSDAKTKYDQATAGRLLHELCAIDGKEIPDYDSAREIAWALDVIYAEWKPKKEDKDPKVLEIMAALKTDLKLDLPAGRNKHILSELPKTLQKISDYSPDKFKEKLQELSKLLPTDKQASNR